MGKRYPLGAVTLKMMYVLAEPSELMCIQMYELFAKMRFGMTDEEYETQQELLGKEPSNYEEFVKRTAVEWKE